MGFMDSLEDFWFGPGRRQSQQLAAGGQQYSYMGANPYASQQNALIQQLMAQAQGRGPSLAAQQYAAANQDAMANQVAMSRGRGGGAMYAAQNQLGQLGQGLAAGSAMARTREQLGAQQLAQGSITAAGQADYQRALANQQMYAQALANMMSQGGIGQSLAGLAGQGLGAYAMLRGGGGGGPRGGGMGGGPRRLGETPDYQVSTPAPGSDDWLRRGGY